MDTSILSQITSTLTSLAITGAIVSALAQITKGWLENKALRKLYVIGLSMLAGVVLYLFQFVPTSFWQNTVVILGFANTAYLMFSKWTDKPSA